jgi:hypothetical protein
LKQCITDTASPWKMPSSEGIGFTRLSVSQNVNKRVLLLFMRRLLAILLLIYFVWYVSVPRVKVYFSEEGGRKVGVCSKYSARYISRRNLPWPIYRRSRPYF